jgi:hypothetical protein
MRGVEACVIAILCREMQNLLSLRIHVSECGNLISPFILSVIPDLETVS